MSGSAKSEGELSSGNKDLVTRARSALQSKNYDYTISLLQTVLKTEPLFLEGRRLLRRAEILKIAGLSSFARQMVSIKVSTAAMGLNSRKSPAEQLVQAEEVLAFDPFHQKANHMIAEAGTALGLPDMKALAYETLAEGKPNDKAALHQLAQVYMELKDFEKAEKTYDKITSLDPRDGEAISGVKNASAAKTQKRNYSTDDYRQSLRNKDLSMQLEQDNRAVKSSDAIEEQIQRLYAQHQERPQDVLPPKQIAQLYVQKNDLVTAIQWYQFTYELGGQTDSALEKMVGDLKMQQLNKEYQLYETALAAETDPDRKAELQAGLEQKKEERNQIRLTQAEQRVQRFPNEGQYRYELGEALFHAGQYQRALRELQQSLKQPSVRHAAMNLMGQSQMGLNMFDLAINTFGSAETELVAWDDTKKEIVYNLGRAYEAMGNTQKALEQDKKIYNMDIGYRDVAHRVESSYAG